MMNMRKLHFALALASVLLGTSILFAQDGRIPGHEATRVPLGIEARQGKLVFESKDTTFQWWFDSRIQLDGASYFENKNEMSNGTIMRRVTFAMKTILWKDWQAEIDFDISEAVLDMRDAFIQYNSPDINLSVKAGNFKEPFGMEELNSSRLLTLMERSAISNALALGRRVGIAASYYTDYGQATVGVFGHETGTKIDKGTRDEGYSTNARLTFAPINHHGSNIHLGTAASFKTPDAVPDLAANTIEIKARTETDVFDPKLLHTGDISDVNYFTRISGELLVVQGPLYLQAEYLGAKVVRWYGKAPVRLGGAYATLAWLITGESRQYFVDEGEIGPIDRPNNSWGALELAARYSICDLNDTDAGVHGGKSNILMLGVNYYPNPSIKLMLNYGKVALDQFATSKGKFAGDDDHSFVQARIQASL
jgi:phosphate-selective porin OprO and OprP